MTDLCKHKAAASSIDWFVRMVTGKHGAEQKETIKILSYMLQEMRATNCSKCATRTNCRDLDAAIKAINESDRNPAFATEPPVIGPLSHRREHMLRTKLVRPSGR